MYLSNYIFLVILIINFMLFFIENKVNINKKRDKKNNINKYINI